MSHTSPPTLCILGCAGFIGSHLVGSLLSRGEWQVCGVDRVHGKVAPFLDDPRFTFVEMDATRIDELRPLMAQADAVINLVALCNPWLYMTVPLDVIEINYDHPVKVARLCGELGKWLIHFSTSEVYGMTAAHVAAADEGCVDQTLNEDDTPLILGPVRAHRWCYAAAKQLFERTLHALGIQKGLNYTVVRPFNFIGPRMDYLPGVDGEGVPRVIACFMDALLHNKPLRLVDGGRSRRVFTYIDDAVDAVLAILMHPRESHRQIFNIGNPANEISIERLAHAMIERYCLLVGDKRPAQYRVESVTAEQFYGTGYQDSDRRVPDISRARQRLGWEPRVALTHALDRTIQGYVEHYGRCWCPGAA